MGLITDRVVIRPCILTVQLLFPPNVEKMPGAICEAPIHLPLRVLSSEDTALKIAVKDSEALKIADPPLPPISLEQLLQELEGEEQNKGSE